ncbi:MAG: hypothetical protein HRU40_13025 [Saprospiraceae bacterium]|nr:hypothetical protein [Saprospiraceae bacterium]
MKKILNLLIIPLLSFSSCAINKEEQGRRIEYTIPENTRIDLVNTINQMSAMDSKYRSVIQLGTLDKSILNKVKELSKAGDIDKYIAFTNSINRTITEAQEDSLKRLQDTLDYQNYLQVKSIINQYGYPSTDRLKIKADNFSPILLHFPEQINPSDYLEEMSVLLTKEVNENRMKAISYARFYDNIITRFLNKPQKYGTVKKFNIKTMTPGFPEIEDIEETNRLRKKLGLPELEEGEYQIANKMK